MLTLIHNTARYCLLSSQPVGYGARQITEVLTVHRWSAPYYLKHVTDPPGSHSHTLDSQFHRLKLCLKEIARTASTRKDLSAQITNKISIEDYRFPKHQCFQSWNKVLDDKVAWNRCFNIIFISLIDDGTRFFYSYVLSGISWRGRCTLFYSLGSEGWYLTLPYFSPIVWRKQTYELCITFHSSISLMKRILLPKKMFLTWPCFTNLCSGGNIWSDSLLSTLYQSFSACFLQHCSRIIQFIHIFASPLAIFTFDFFFRLH